VHVDVKLQDTSDGETVTTAQVDGRRDDLVGLVTEAASKLREGLAVGALTPGEREGVVASLPAGAQAQRLYAEGLAQMNLSACAAARTLLEEVIVLEPAFPLAHSALSEVMDCLGHSVRSREEAREAVRLSANLPPEMRLVANAHFHDSVEDYVHALEDYRTLFQLYPDSYGYGFRLGGLQLRTRDDDAARTTLAALRKLPPPAGDDPELDIMEMRMRPWSGLRTTIGVFEKIRVRADARGETLTEADIHSRQARLLHVLGDEDAALEAILGAKKIFRTASDDDGVLMTLALEAQIRQARGEMPVVDDIRRESLAIANKVDSPWTLAPFDSILADTYAAAGNLATQRDILGDLRRWLHDGGQLEPEASLLIEIAWRAVERGDLVEAGKLRAEARAILSGLPTAIVNLDGMILEEEIGLSFLTGDLDDARKLVEAALPNLPEEVRGIVHDSLSLHTLLLDSKYAEAEAEARRFLDRAGRVMIYTWSDVALEPDLQAQFALVEILLDAHRLDEARAVLAQVVGNDLIDPRIGGIPLQLQFQLAMARLDLESADSADNTRGEQALADLAARTGKAGLILEKLRAQVTLGRHQVAHGRGDAGHALITSATKEAAERGFVHFARWAQRP
jgi:tetratricopeptide (TPR) repeat protein